MTSLGELASLLAAVNEDEADRRWPEIVGGLFSIAETEQWRYVSLLCLAHLASLGALDLESPAYAEALAFGHRINDALFLEICRRTSTPVGSTRQLRLPAVTLPFLKLRWVSITNIRALVFYIVAYSKVFKLGEGAKWASKAILRDFAKLDKQLGQGALLVLVKQGAALSTLEWRHFTKISMYEAIHVRIDYGPGFLNTAIRVGGVTERVGMPMSKIVVPADRAVHDADRHFAVRALGFEVFRLLRAMQEGTESIAITRSLQFFYRLLLAPLFERPSVARQISRLGSFPTLVVATHGSLAQLPFAALHDGERHLVQRFNVVQAPPLLSTKDFGLGGLDWSAMHGGEPISADAPVRALLDLDGLDHAAREAGSLRRHFGSRAQITSGEEQETWDAALVRRLMQGRGIALLSSHIHPGQTRAWETVIKAPSGNLIPFNEILTEPMMADLLVLAGCNSVAQTDWLADGEGSVTSLCRRAGIQSVIATLWPVNDHAASLYMEALIEALSLGKSRAAAHGDAQRAVFDARVAISEVLPAKDRLISQPGTGVPVAPTLSFEHPRFWAGFSLSGAWR